MVDSTQTNNFNWISLGELIIDSTDKLPSTRIDTHDWLEDAKKKIEEDQLPANDKLVHLVCYFYRNEFRRIKEEDGEILMLESIGSFYGAYVA